MAFLPPTRQNLTRRSFVLAGAALASFPVLMGRLFYLQGISGSRYKQLAEENRVSLRLIQPERGRLLDRGGQVIAQDKQVFRLVLIPEQCPDIPAVLKRLSGLVELPQERIDKVIEDSKKLAKFSQVTVLKTLPFRDLAQIQVNLPDLPGIDFVPVALRHYFGGESVGHIVGYTGRPDEATNQRISRFTAWSPDFPVGRRGLEKSLEDKLRGKSGYRNLEVNAYGRAIREIERNDPIDGEDVNLSLDLDLQVKAWEELEGYEGGAVVMNVQTGEILAAASRPSFDTNNFVDGLDQEEWKALQQDPNKPLINRPLQGVYAPGSTFKTVVALAALNEGLAKPEEEITCKGHIQFGNRKFHCWKRHGTLNLSQAIQHSCDIYFYELGDRLGIDKISQYARLFGLGQAYNTGLPESAGLVPTRDWKRRVYNEPWVGGENLITAIGQGYMLTTPLQLATMTARVATGKKVEPTLEVVQSDQGLFEEITIPQKHFDIVHKGMYDVVNHKRGTAYWYARIKEFDMAGKSGTSQVISQRFDDDVDMETVNKRKRPHALFVAYAPADNPRFAVSVVVEHGASGSRAASPIVKNLMKATMEKYPL